MESNGAGRSKRILQPVYATRTLLRQGLPVQGDGAVRGTFAGPSLVAKALARVVRLDLSDGLGVDQRVRLRASRPVPASEAAA